MGETGLQLLKDGLAKNESITELDLTGCNLTDLGAMFVGAILKARASRYAQLNGTGLADPNTDHVCATLTILPRGCRIDKVSLHPVLRQFFCCTLLQS